MLLPPGGAISTPGGSTQSRFHLLDISGFLQAATPSFIFARIYRASSAVFTRRCLVFRQPGSAPPPQIGPPQASPPGFTAVASSASSPPRCTEPDLAWPDLYAVASNPRLLSPDSRRRAAEQRPSLRLPPGSSASSFVLDGSSADHRRRLYPRRICSRHRASHYSVLYLRPDPAPLLPAASASLLRHWASSPPDPVETTSSRPWSSSTSLPRFPDDTAAFCLPPSGSCLRASSPLR